MSGEWPADPSDPRCPHCDEPVSATASYCMHCEGDLPASDFGDLREAGDDVSAQVQAAAAAERAASGESAAPSEGVTGYEGSRPPGEDDHEGALLDPDSLLDDVSTVMVGLVAGLVSIVLVGLVSFWSLPDPIDVAAFWLGLGGGAAVGVWAGRSRTVFGAARKAGVAVGGLLALVPVAIGAGLHWESTGDAVGGVFVFGLFLWPVALVVAAVGWLLGYGGVDGA